MRHRRAVAAFAVGAAALTFVAARSVGDDGGGGGRSGSAGATTTAVEPRRAPAAGATASPDEDGGATGATSPAGAIVDGTFTAGFDGTPASPEPWRPANWDVTVHSRDRETFARLEDMAAMHGDDCGAPPATHQVSSYEQAVFVCRNHMMTAIKASGYGLIYLTPDAQVDFSAGEAVVRWDMSTLRTTLRDWPDLWITPYEDNLQLALESFYPDLSGPPKRAVHVVAVDVDGGTGFRVEVFRDHQPIELNTPVFLRYDDVLQPDAARRDTFELRIGGGRLRFGMPAHDLWWYDGELPDLGWDTGVVTFGHHSYNPLKDCAECHPNTWHWDNVSISPAIPFTILRGDRRVVDATRPAAVTFPTAAPVDAHVRFAAIGDDVEVSTDGGRSWRAAERQSQGKETAGEHFASYWTKVPAGTTSVAIRATDWWGGPWLARDITVWAPSARS